VRFALETRSGPGPAADFTRTLSAIIADLGGEVGTDDQAPDMVLSAGGDGTMLGAVRRALAWDVPVLGFNLGTLGFLAEAEPDEVEQVMGMVMSGQYRIEERMTIAASIRDTTVSGVNDVVVEKVDSTRLISLDVTVDDEPFARYRADGLIVATPTGSTAYSFSAGGPLIDPRVEALVLTPVASHSLFDRAMVLPAGSVVGITVSRDRDVKANVDKTSLGELAEGEKVVVRRGDKPALFVTFDKRSFAGLVRGKFGLD
jgi:NAD+ kinase